MPTVTLTWTNFGIDRATKLLINKSTALADMVAALGQGTYTPSPTTSYTDVDETTDAAYTRQDLLPSTFTGSTSSGVALYTTTSYTFFFSGTPGPQTIKNFFLTDGSNNVWASALLSSPYPIPSSGGSITFTLAQQGQQC